MGLPYRCDSFHVEQYNVIPTHYIEDTLTGWTHGKGFYHSMASHFDSDALYIEHHHTRKHTHNDEQLSTLVSTQGIFDSAYTL